MNDEQLLECAAMALRWDADRTLSVLTAQHLAHGVRRLMDERKREKMNHGFTKEALEDARTRIASLFEAVKHGDEKHQAWLKEAIDTHFAPYDFCSDCGARFTGHHACEGRPT